MDNVLEVELSQLQAGELSFKTQLKIQFLPLNNVSKKFLEKSLTSEFLWHLLMNLKNK